MRSRKSLNRRAFRPETLESRLSPSHVGGLTPVAAAHVAHASAHVRHFSDTSSRDRVNSVDRSHGVERSVDTVGETNSIDTSPKDPSSPDPSGQS